MWRIRSLLTRLKNPERIEEDLDAEVREYFETVVERNVARGLSLEEARRAARLHTGRIGAGASRCVRSEPGRVVVV